MSLDNSNGWLDNEKSGAKQLRASCRCETIRKQTSLRTLLIAA